MLKDYYAILGLAFDASSEQIHFAYRREALKWHPDKHPDQDTMDRMKEINEAYSILSNCETRERYDREYSLYHMVRDGTNNQHDSEKEEDIHDTKLKDDIQKASETAKKHVEELLETLRQDSARATKGAWDGAKSFIYASIFLSVISALIGKCSY